MIFNLFKSKPTLKDLIPKGFVDIHSHILPGIDDGAKNVEESLKLITEMNKLGFSKIIGTPHTYEGLYNNTNRSIKKSFNSIKQIIPKNLNISYSSEYLLDKSIIDRAENKSLISLKSNYILVELSYLAPPNNIYDIIFKLRMNDYIPVLAHPERYIFYNNNFEEYYRLKKAGCLFQINLSSLTGMYGKDITLCAKKLVNKNLIDFSGSDIHKKSHIDVFDKKIIFNDFKKIEKINLRNSLFK